MNSPMYFKKALHDVAEFHENKKYYLYRIFQKTNLSYCNNLKLIDNIDLYTATPSWETSQHQVTCIADPCKGTIIFVLT